MKALAIGPIRPISGAASRLGPEDALVREFSSSRVTTSRWTLYATEVPVPGGVIDLLEIRIAASSGGLRRALARARPLKHLEDRTLRLLASLARGRSYRYDTLIDKGFSPRDITRLTGCRALTRNDGLIRRPTLFPDYITELASFEFKFTGLTDAVVQAARRRPVVDRTYVVLPSTDMSRWPERVIDIASHSGVGVVETTTGRTLLTAKKVAVRAWPKFLVARSVARGT